MKAKDVWRWLLSKFSNSVLLDIHQKNKIICKGFRTNSLQEIKANRNRIIVNVLNKENYTKLLNWARDNPLHRLENDIKNKELNELVELANQKGAHAVLLKLFSENEEQLAVQLFAILQDEASTLLEISNESIGLKTENITESNKKNQNEQMENKGTTSKSDEKIIVKLGKKIENLMNELKKRENQHKQKVEEMEKNQTRVKKELNDRNQLYANLIKEKEEIEFNFIEEREKWKVERYDYLETIEELKNELNKIKENPNMHLAKVENHRTNDCKFSIIVIGKPTSLTHFYSNKVNYDFIEADTVHNFEFSNDYDAYWVLLYELSPKDQLLLTVNNTFSTINKEKVKICKNFNEVKREINQYID